MSSVARHGESRLPWTRRYRAWTAMRCRCRDKTEKNYGGRGIKVCARWEMFENFALDMGEHPGAGWTLERLRVNEDYGPTNCVWATRKTQSRNRRCNKLTEAIAADIRQRFIPGKKGSPGNRSALADEFAVAPETISQVVHGDIYV